MHTPSTLASGALSLVLLCACQATAAPNLSRGPLTSGMERESNDDPRRATELAVIARVQGGVGGIGDGVDCYALTPQVPGTLTFEVQNTGSGGETSRLKGPVLRDASGALVTRVAADIGRGEAAEGSAAVAAGVRYVLSIEARDARRQPYRLTTRFVAD